MFRKYVTTAVALLVLGAAACSPSAQTNPTAAPTSAPSATTAATTIPTSAPTEEATAEMTEVAAAEATPEATEAATSEATIEATAEMTAEATTEATAESTVAVEVASCTRLNLNTLTGDDLMATIPNFTSRMVREFEEYRPYVSIQQFRREIGKYVDEAQVTDWEQYVFVPVDPNDSDADTLMQLPGVDEPTADALIANRPYASNEAFLEALAAQVSADELAQASCYLVTTT